MPEKKIEKGETLWSLKPVTKPAAPAKGNPVDAFLEKKLAEKGLTFSNQADLFYASTPFTGDFNRSTSTSEEAANFQKAWNVNPEKAYSDKVEELLASKQYSERWAQHWLDAIRWSETGGSESNLYRNNSGNIATMLSTPLTRTNLTITSSLIKLLVTKRDFKSNWFMVAGPHVPPATVGQEPFAIKEARYDRLDQLLSTVGASYDGHDS